MADIQMRFHRDMLALTSPLSPVLRRQEFDTNDLAQAHFIEEDTLREGYRMLCASMAPVVVTETAKFLPARLAHEGLSDKLPELARIALSIVNDFKPQHVLVELGESGLPLDPTSKTSLLEHRAQYERAGRAFEETGTFDAFLLFGFTSITTLKCALMGLAKVSTKPIFATVRVDEDGNLLRGAGLRNTNTGDANLHDTSARDASYTGDANLHDTGARDASLRNTGARNAKGNKETLARAYEVMAEYGASVIGFQTSANTEHMFDMTKLAVENYNLPVLVEVLAGDDVVSRSSARNSIRSNSRDRSEKYSDASASSNISTSHDIPNKRSCAKATQSAGANLKSGTSSPYTSPRDMFDVAERMNNAGVQFLRAVGDATPAFASALAASCAGVDVVREDV